MTTEARDAYFMEQALAVAELGLSQGELPIGAVVVADDRVIASAYTQERAQGRFLVHADLLALEMADRLRPFPGPRREAALYVNLEPCLMCMGAAMSFFIGRICYGSESPGDGAAEVVQAWQRCQADFPGYQVPSLRGGMLRDRSISLLNRYVEANPHGAMSRWAAALVDSAARAGKAVRAN